MDALQDRGDLRCRGGDPVADQVIGAHHVLVLARCAVWIQREAMLEDVGEADVVAPDLHRDELRGDVETVELRRGGAGGGGLGGGYVPRSGARGGRRARR